MSSNPNSNNNSNSQNNYGKSQGASGTNTSTTSSSSINGTTSHSQSQSQPQPHQHLHHPSPAATSAISALLAGNHPAVSSSSSSSSPRRGGDNSISGATNPNSSSTSSTSSGLGSASSSCSSSSSVRNSSLLANSADPVDQLFPSSGSSPSSTSSKSSAATTTNKMKKADTAGAASSGRGQVAPVEGEVNEGQGAAVAAPAAGDQLAGGVGGVEANGPNNEDLPQNRIRRGNICEAWQSTKSCLKERVAYLFNNETLSDISFLVGRTRVRIPGHKFVLAVGSPVFDAMFNGPLAMQENEKTVELPDVEPDAFLALLKFLYTDDVSVSAETVLTVLYTAKKYAVPALEEHCVAFLKDNLTAENAFLLLSQARLFDEPQLAALCLDCIDKNTAAAFSADGFTEVDLDTLCAALERDTLRIKELCLFQASLRWASHECTRRGMDVTAQNQRYTLGRALHLIRFPLMPVEDFSIEVAQMNLLTETELVRLFLNFNISTNNVHLRPKQEFIDRARCYMTGKQLSVFRFQQVETRWGYNGLNDQIRFTTDRRIYVVGFGLYGGLFGTKEYKVDIQLSHTLQSVVLGHHSDSFCSDGSKSTFKVMFREPIEVLPEVTYTASATLRGPDSHYGAKGQRKVGVECPDGTMVNFTFSYSSDNNNGTSVEDGQIPEIIFHT